MVAYITETKSLLSTICNFIFSKIRALLLILCLLIFLYLHKLSCCRDIESKPRNIKILVQLRRFQIQYDLVKIIQSYKSCLIKPIAQFEQFRSDLLEKQSSIEKYKLPTPAEKIGYTLDFSSIHIHLEELHIDSAVDVTSSHGITQVFFFFDNWHYPSFIF